MASQRIQFLKGTHHGYKFDSAGKVTAVKSYTLPYDSGAHSNGTIVKWPQHGDMPFTPVVDGVWAGYVVPLGGELPDGKDGSPLLATIQPKLGTVPPPQPVPDPDPPPLPGPDPEPEPTPVPPGSVVNATPADWRSKWSSIPAGSTLQLAAGTYTAGTGSYGMDEVKSGEPGQPITVAGGPSVTFDGNGAEMCFWFRNAHDLVIRDIKITDYWPDDTGVFTLENSQRVTMERVTIEGCKSPSPVNGYSNDHGFYLGGGNSDVWIVDCTVKGGFSGSSTGYLAGGAVHVYHAPGPVNSGIRGGLYTGCNYGVMWDQSGTGNKIESGDFRGNRYGSVKTSGSGVTVSSTVLK